MLRYDPRCVFDSEGQVRPLHTMTLAEAQGIASMEVASHLRAHSHLFRIDLAERLTYRPATRATRGRFATGTRDPIVGDRRDNFREPSAVVKLRAWSAGQTARRRPGCDCAFACRRHTTCRCWWKEFVSIRTFGAEQKESSWCSRCNSRRFTP